MRNKLLEQDFARSSWLLEHRFNEVDDLVRFWAVFKKRQTFCPDIEKVDGDVWTNIF